MAPRKKSRIFRFIFISFLLLCVFYFIGPRPEKPQLDFNLPEVSSDLIALQDWIDQKESTNPLIKPGNAARIHFFDSIPQKTKYSIVYLHGFSASGVEGDPVHRELAQALGANLYVPRLYKHGLIQSEPLLDFDAQGYWETALEALAVAKQLGEKVIVIGTSTGACLAMKYENDPAIAALILYSPNVAINNPAAFLLSKHWGIHLARWVKGGNYHIMEDADALKKQFWNAKYRLEALTHVQRLVEVSMKKSTFEKIKIPVFMAYFYKNETVQDDVVSIPAMLEMYQQLGTPDALKHKVAFPDATDHVMTSYVTGTIYDNVTRETLDFLHNVLN